MHDHLSPRFREIGRARGRARVIPALGADKKLNVAWIGVGSRGDYLIQRFLAVPGNKQEATLPPCGRLYRPSRARQGSCSDRAGQRAEIV